MAQLLNVPSDTASWSRWSFANHDCIDQIRQAIERQKGVRLPDYQIEPINPDDIDSFLSANQQAHTDFTSALGLQSSDLIEVDLHDKNQLQAWIYLNYQELNSACQVLRIGP